MKNASHTRERLVLNHLLDIAVSELEVPQEKVSAVTMGTTLVENLQMDSLRQVMLLASIERDYGCVFDSEELITVETVGDLVTLIVDQAEEDKLGKTHPDL